METKLLVRLGLAFATLAVALLPLASAAGDNPLRAEAFVLSPPASAAPAGNWSFVAPYGYMWMPEATMEAEWAPWDPWWAMPYGRWAWAEGCGWGWTPLIPPWDMSPLGWGYDSWYGGWYGFLPNGMPADPFGGWGRSVDGDTAFAQAWMNRHHHREPDIREPKAASPKVVTVVAAPPPTLMTIPPWREVKDRTEPDAQGLAHPDRPSRHGGKGSGDSEGPTRVKGGHHGGSRTEPAPVVRSGGVVTPTPSGNAGHKHH